MCLYSNICLECVYQKTYLCVSIVIIFIVCTRKIVAFVSRLKLLSIPVSIKRLQKSLQIENKSVFTDIYVTEPDSFQCIIVVVTFLTTSTRHTHLYSIRTTNIIAICVLPTWREKTGKSGHMKVLDFLVRAQGCKISPNIEWRKLSKNIE